MELVIIPPESQQPHPIMNRVGAIKKACDQCNRRRVKCDGQLPCRTCVKGYVECTFVKPVLKKGPAPNPEGRRRRRKQQQQSPSDAGSAQPTTFNAVAGPSRLPCTLSPPATDDTSPTEAYSDCLNPAIFSEYKALRDIPRRASPSEPFPNPTSYIISIAHDQTKETDQHDASPSFSSNNQYEPFQHVTAPPVAPLDLLVAMPCDDANWEELFAQKISSRTASPFKLLDVGPFSDVSFGEARGGMQQPGWVVTEPWNTLAGGVPTIGGMHRNDGSALTIPSPPTGQLVPNEKDWSPMFAVCLDSLIRPQIEIFFSRIAPMIPVFTAQYIRARLCGPCHDKDFVGMVLTMTALSLIHPLNVEESRQRQTRVKQAQILMDEALRLRDGWQFGSTATVESIMTSYLMFGTLYEMGYAAGAKLRLREAVSLGETMGLHDPRSYLGLGRAEVLRRLKMYWVLSVTERAYSLQHLGGIIFEGPISTAQVLPPKNLADINDDDDGTSPSLRYLAQLFSFIDQDIVTCWNGRCDSPSCRCLSEKRAIDILSKLGGSPTEVFGVDFEIQLRNLAESQRADLLITWQWLRNRIWRLAFLHGLARESGPVELSRVYLANVAIAALDICRDLSTRSMDAHGAGFMQKLYDIASAIPELLRHDFVSEPRMFTPAQTAHLSQIVRQLYGHVARYRAGNSEFVQPLAEAITLASLTVIQE